MAARKVFIPDEFLAAGGAGRPGGGAQPRGGRPEGVPDGGRDGRNRPFVPDWMRGRDPAAAGRFLPDWAEGSTRKGPARSFPRPLVVKGGHCVIPHSGIVTQDLLIEEGRIRAMGESIPTEGRDVLRAEGRYVLPGLVDPHVHAGIFAPFEEEISSETASALANGVTTVGLYVGGRGSYLPVLDGLLEAVARRSHVDVLAHLVLFDRDQLRELPLYAAKYGVRSFKIYMAGIPGLIPSADEGFMLDAMEAVAGLGSGAVLNVHAENSKVLEWADERERAGSPEGGLKAWERTHPAFSEREAIQRALILAERSGARLYFVHVSAAESVAVLRRAKAEAPGRFFAETTSPYLTTTYDSPQGELAVMSPPIRSEEDRKALWEGLRDGTLDSIGTDHTPLTREQKTGGRTFWETMPGYPAVGTHLPLLLDGARRAGLGIERLVEKVSSDPARIFGVYPRKGTILPGSDADLVLVDLGRQKAIGPKGARSRADFALHEGERSIGWPVAIVKAGRVLYPDDPSLDLSPFAGSEYLRRY